MPKHLASLALAAALFAALPALAAPPAAKSRVQRIDISVTSQGFEPAAVKVRAGQPVRLVVTRRTDRTCATHIVVKEFGIDKALPLDRPVEVRFTPRKQGAVRYACGMDMIAGRLIVE